METRQSFRVVKISSIALAKVEMTIGYKTQINPYNEFRVDEREDKGGGFTMFLPAEIYSKIDVGTKIRVLCIPNVSFTVADEVLVVWAGTDTNNILSKIWSRSSYWNKMD